MPHVHVHSLLISKKIIYLGYEKSQRSVTHDSLRYINILTYLLTYLLAKVTRNDIIDALIVSTGPEGLAVYGVARGCIIAISWSYFLLYSPCCYSYPWHSRCLSSTLDNHVSHCVISSSVNKTRKVMARQRFVEEAFNILLVVRNTETHTYTQREKERERGVRDDSTIIRQ